MASSSQLLVPPSAGVRVRPGLLVAMTLALAYGGGLWLHLVHEAEGATETGAPSPVIHWLRDSTLLVPVAMAAVWVTLALAARLRPGLAARRAGPVTVVTLAASVALVTSIAEALASPLHGVVFGAHHHHDGVELPLPVHMAYDGLIALAPNLLIVLVVLLAVRGRAWRPAALASTRRRLAFRALPSMRRV
ncbi:MAG: hypothetical protein WCK58_02495, partial [Chloroflexota bacterium]